PAALFWATTVEALAAASSVAIVNNTLFIEMLSMGSAAGGPPSMSLLHDSEQDFGADEIHQVVEPHIAEGSLTAVDFGGGTGADFRFGDGFAQFLLVEGNANQHRVAFFAADFGAALDFFDLASELF